MADPQDKPKAVHPQSLAATRRWKSSQDIKVEEKNVHPLRRQLSDVVESPTPSLHNDQTRQNDFKLQLVEKIQTDELAVN